MPPVPGLSAGNPESLVQTGSRLGPYELEGLIASGGIGDVYKARDLRLRRYVAVKVLRTNAGEGGREIERLLQEAHTTALLNHPNIAAVHDVGAVGGAAYVVSELLCGETLRDKLASGSLPVRTAINYATGAARGLIAAHDVGVIHRDLKPENLFITVDDRVKILDFGLARCRRALLGAGRREPVSTHGGTLPGTAGYMSPEQVLGEAADQRSDIFALGAILHEMISGAPPFRAPTSVETMHAILEDDPAPLSGRGDVSPELARIVRHCLEKSPDARFQSARDLGFVLDAAPCTTARPCTRTPRWRTLLHSLAASLQGGVRYAPGRR